VPCRQSAADSNAILTKENSVVVLTLQDGRSLPVFTATSRSICEIGVSRARADEASPWENGRESLSAGRAALGGAAWMVTQCQAAPSGPLPIALPSTGAVVQRQRNGLCGGTVPAELCVCRATRRATNAPQIAIVVRSSQVRPSAVDRAGIEVGTRSPSQSYLSLFWARVRAGAGRGNSTTCRKKHSFWPGFR